MFYPRKPRESLNLNVGWQQGREPCFDTKVNMHTGHFNSIIPFIPWNPTLLFTYRLLAPMDKRARWQSFLMNWTFMFCLWSTLTAMSTPGQGYINSERLTEFLPVTSCDIWSKRIIYFQSRMWRKTRSTKAGSSCVGVDPNRNFNAGWCGEYLSD